MVYEVFAFYPESSRNHLIVSAGVFSSRDKANVAISWIQSKEPELLCFIRERNLDKINGRFAFNMLSESKYGDLIEDIEIF